MRAYPPPLWPTVLLPCFAVLDLMRPAAAQNTTPHDLCRRRALPAVIARVGGVMPPVMGLLAALGIATAAYSQQPFVYGPPPLAPERQTWLATLPDPPHAPASPAADASVGGAQRQPASEAEHAAMVEAVVPLTQPAVTPMHLGGVPVVDVKPQGWTDNRQIVLYTHGGGAALSAVHSTLFSVALMASTTGLRVLAVDYPVAPGGTWQDGTAHVITVVKALLT